MKYFVINKELDYKRGYMENTEYRQGVLRLRDGAERGVFISRVFDGKEEELVWHRFLAKGQGPGGASFLCSFYAADSLEFVYEGKRYEISGLLRDREIPFPVKKKMVSGFLRKQALFPKDALLHEVKGRYLFFTAELYAQGGEGTQISEMTLFFPKEDWLKYLPGVYGKEKAGASFTSRYLGIFQSFYDDNDRRIRESASLMNPKDTDGESLKKIAEWFRLEDLYIWPEDKLRKLLRMAPRLFAETGTVQGMLDMIELYTGEPPILVECGNLSQTGDRETEEKLYGYHPYEFVLLIKEKYLSSVKEYQALSCVIKQMKPVHMEVRVISLKPDLTLGAYSYLGINSRIGNYKPLRLDGHGALTFTAVGMAET